MKDEVAHETQPSPKQESTKELIPEIPAQPALAAQETSTEEARVPIHHHVVANHEATEETKTTPKDEVPAKVKLIIIYSTDKNLPNITITLKEWSKLL